MNTEKKIRLLIATGVFPPDIGGPATITKFLLDRLPEAGVEVDLVTYTDDAGRSDPASGTEAGIHRIDRRRNIIFRYWQCLRLIWKLAKQADIIYAFDLLSVGLPCAIVKTFKRDIKLAVRLGGDHQWEQAVENGTFFGTLDRYYIDRKFGSWERLVFHLSNFVLSRCDLIIFNAEIIRDTYVSHRQVERARTDIIKNIEPAIPSVPARKAEKDHLNILYAGRLVAFKNLFALIDAFILTEKKDWSKKLFLDMVGEGPAQPAIAAKIEKSGLTERIRLLPKLSHVDTLAKIAASDAIAMVSLTEVNSNVVIEALALGRPVILSKESEEYHIGNKDRLIYYADPLDIADIAEKMETALRDGLTGSLLERIGTEGMKENDVSWGDDEVVDKHLKAFKSLLKLN